MRILATLTCLAAAILTLVAAPATAHAVPAFARKYKTSCLTCHIVFPKLNPFGEAFRRNGFRFPGVDEDQIKAEQIPLGQAAQRKMFPRTVLPDFLPASVPLAVAFTGAAIVHPDTDSSGGRADHGAAFTLQDLVAEAGIFAAGSFSATVTFFSELAFEEDAAEIEDAFVWFNDLVGPKHAVNVRVGKLHAALSTTAVHSSYLADEAIPTVPATALFGAEEPSWAPGEPYGTIEVNGVLGGRVDYAAGVTSGANVDVRVSENVYGHVGFKIGGMRLDGEGAWAPADPMRPWEETALTAGGFIYRSVSHFTSAAGDIERDRAVAAGGALRLQWRSLELDGGAVFEHHTGALPGGGDADAQTQFYELSYVVFPWLVPAARFEVVRIDPEAGAAVQDLRWIPGLAGLIYANLELRLLASFEWADGAPPAGWEPAGGVAAPAAPGATVGFEIESIRLALSCAF